MVPAGACSFGSTSSSRTTGNRVHLRTAEAICARTLALTATPSSKQRNRLGTLELVIKAASPNTAAIMMGLTPRRPRSSGGPSNDLPFSGERRTVASSVARPRGGAGAARAVAASAHRRATSVGVRPLQRLVRQRSRGAANGNHVPLRSAPQDPPSRLLVAQSAPPRPVPHRRL